MIDTLREHWGRVLECERQIGAIERRLGQVREADLRCQAISEIPGIDVLAATAAVAAMGDPHSFRSGREFAAWLGWCPDKWAPEGVFDSLESANAETVTCARF